MNKTYELLKNLPDIEAGKTIFYFKEPDQYFYINKLGECKYYFKSFIENNPTWFREVKPDIPESNIGVCEYWISKGDYFKDGIVKEIKMDGNKLYFKTETKVKEPIRTPLVEKPDTVPYASYKLLFDKNQEILEQMSKLYSEDQVKIIASQMAIAYIKIQYPSPTPNDMTEFFNQITS